MYGIDFDDCIRCGGWVGGIAGVGVGIGVGGIRVEG